MELIAQFNFNPPGGVNNPAFQVGFVAGIIIAAVVFGAIPIVLGISRGHPVVGVFGGLVTAVTAGLFGCLGGLPMALVFCGIILALGKPPGKPRRQKRYRDEDEYDYEDEDDRYEDRDDDDREGRRKPRRDQ